MDFKDRIKKRRLEIGATLEEVGKIVGVSKATVLRWESGAIENVRRDKIEALAKALKVSPAYIMGWEDEPDMSRTGFRDIIKQRRASLGLTLSQVAQSVGVSEATVSRWESGDISDIGMSKIAALAKALKVSPNFIMDWDEQDAQKAPSGNPQGAEEDALRKAFLEGASRLSEGRKIQLIEFLRFHLAQEEAEAHHKREAP